MTPEERVAAYLTWGHDRAHEVIEQAMIGLAARAGGEVAIVDGMDLMHVAVQAAMTSGVEVGIRAALLDPEAATRLREALAPTMAGDAEDAKRHVNGALRKVQELLDAACVE